MHCHGEKFAKLNCVSDKYIANFTLFVYITRILLQCGHIFLNAFVMNLATSLHALVVHDDTKT